MFKRLLPRKDEFFRRMEASADKVVEVVKAFREILRDPSRSKEGAAVVHRIEHEADEIAHETIALLHKTFVTPLDRNEISGIFKRLDDVVDLVEAAAQRYYVYEMKEPRADVVQMLDILERQVGHVRAAVGLLSDMRQAPALRAILIEIQTCENQADEVLRRSMGALFREVADPKELLKWKEVIEALEDATDRCEDLADLFENVLLEYS